MVRLLLALYDSKAEIYFAPFVSPNMGTAYRNLADEVNKHDATNMLCNHPGDFELCDLGTYDEETGYIEVHKSPKMVCKLSDLVIVGE